MRDRATRAGTAARVLNRALIRVVIRAAWLLAVPGVLLEAQGGTPPAPPTAAPVGGNGPDPLRGDPARRSPLGEQARALQETFERNHRLGLRFYNGGADAGCEVPLGRICYWNNNGDVPPPAERADAKLEREQLMELLTRAQQADPADDWVSGMLVRYAIEVQQADVAVAAAQRCAGTAWWCAALEGTALHVANRHAGAGGDARGAAVRVDRPDLVAGPGGARRLCRPRLCGARRGERAGVPAGAAAVDAARERYRERVVRAAHRVAGACAGAHPL
jgi:hypothetical protein